MSEQLVTAEAATNATNTTLQWANEWLGYLALGMFSMVLFIPTLGIIGLMVWEYFSDEAERKAERQKEIEQVMRDRYLGKRSDEKNEEDDDDLDGLEEDDIDDEDFEPEEMETLIHKRKPKMTKPEDFDCL